MIAAAVGASELVEAYRPDSREWQADLNNSRPMR